METTFTVVKEAKTPLSIQFSSMGLLDGKFHYSEKSMTEEQLETSLVNGDPIISAQRLQDASRFLQNLKTRMMP